MKSKIVCKYIGKTLICYAALLLIPCLIGLIYKENSLSFLLTSCLTLVMGYILSSLKVERVRFHAKEGFKIVTLSWILISILGAIPIMLDTKVTFIDAIFESVSGFTTTGATIFDDVSNLPHTILFWRDFMHFIGGMGVLAFVMAIIPLTKNDKSMYVLKAEMPGPEVSKLVPSIKETLYYLYGIYFVLTFTEFILLVIAKVPVFDSILISMGTAGTGGFSPLTTSIATYNIMTKWIVTIFMFLFGVNFNIYFLILMKDIKTAFKSEELRVYILLYLSTVVLLAINSISLYNNLSETILSAFFNTSSFISSTGFSIGNVNIYPTVCRVWILFIMIVSSCAGSTCGGFKVSRLILVFKIIRRDIQKIIHPNSVKVITFEGKRVPEEIISSTKGFMFLYIILLFMVILIVGLDNHSLEITINAAFTTFANVGLYFEIPSFSIFSNLSKIVMSLGMLLGRLEIYPIIALLTNTRD